MTPMVERQNGGFVVQAARVCLCRDSIFLFFFCPCLLWNTVSTCFEMTNFPHYLPCVTPPPPQADFVKYVRSVVAQENGDSVPGGWDPKKKVCAKHGLSIASLPLVPHHSCSRNTSTSSLLLSVVSTPPIAFICTAFHSVVRR